MPRDCRDEIAALSFTSNLQRVEDRIFLQALVNYAAETDGKRISLLRNLGSTMRQHSAKLASVLGPETVFVPIALDRSRKSHSSKQQVPSTSAVGRDHTLHRLDKRIRVV